MEKVKSVFIVLYTIFYLFLTTSCFGEPSYYPLDNGKKWTFQLSVKNSMGGIQSLRASQVNLSSRDLSGRKVVPQQTTYSNGISGFNFISEDSNGISIVASQKDGDIDPKLEPSPQYIIKFPISKGTKWEYNTETGFLSQKMKVTLKKTIENTSEVVTVLGGTFENCIRVKGLAESCVRAGNRSVRISVETYEWYAPNVGLIKEIRREKSNSFLIGQGEGTCQLLSFSK